MTEPLVPPPVRHRLPVPRIAWVLLASTAVVGVGLALGLPAALLALAGAALTGAVFLGYSSLVALTGEGELTLQEALTLVAPSAEEEQKRSILRALKDLEYELAAGKISPADHAELTARYRDEARRLLRLVSDLQAEQVARAERRVEAHLTASNTRSAAADGQSTVSSTGPSLERTPSPATGRARRPRCPACGRRAARSARYCSGCGATLPRQVVAPTPPPTPGDREG